jgi:hypothetical protein
MPVQALKNRKVLNDSHPSLRSKNKTFSMSIFNISSHFMSPHGELHVYTLSIFGRYDRFHGIDEPDTFFLPKDRQRILYEILATTTYGKRKRAEVGVDRLLEEDVFLAAFPLHDVCFCLCQLHVHLFDVIQ